MRRITLLTLPLLLAGCGDKILGAKTVVSFVTLGVETARNAVNTVVKAKKAECTAKAKGDVEVYKTCFAPTQKMVDATGKLWPQLDRALALASSAIKAYEQKTTGQSVDYLTPIKHGVCLLTKLAEWLPAKYRSKIDRWLVLAGAFTCVPVKTSLQVDPQRAKMLLSQLKSLLIELGAKS